MEGLPEFGRFNGGLEWDKKLNGISGLIAITAFVNLAAIIIFIFIVRIFQFPTIRKRYFITNKTQSVPTRALKAIVLLLLIAGLVGLTYYNIHKMIYDPSKISVTVEKNKSSPSMLFCPMDLDAVFTVASAVYVTSLNGLNRNQLIDDVLESNTKLPELKNITTPNGNCRFLNGTSSPQLNFDDGGIYALSLGINSSYHTVALFIGDTSNEMNWDLSFPQGNYFSDVKIQALIGPNVMLQYTETQHAALNGSLYRSFQTFLIVNGGPPENLSSFNNNNENQETNMFVLIFAPRVITKQVEEPSSH